MEMYDRLEEIYGLPHFNFGGEGAIYMSPPSDSGGGEDFIGDIMSGGSGGSDDVLDDLFGAAPPSPTMFAEDTNANVDTSSDAVLPPFEKFRVLHVDPMVLAVDDFFTDDECDALITSSLAAELASSGGDASDEFGPMLLGKSRTVGKDSRSQAQRTSTTWFHHYRSVPSLLAKASRLLGGTKSMLSRWEEPQTVRYKRGEKFTWHLDALAPDVASDKEGGGQRIATMLVYLTDLEEEGSGGATMFRDLGGNGGEEALKV